MKNRFALLILAMLITTSFSSAQGYKIKTTIHGLKEVDIYLGYHFGDKNYVVDTTKINSKGYGTFEGIKSLERGIYIVITPDKKYFELLIDKDQTFEVETDTCSNPADFIKTMKISGSDENKQFLEYQLFMTKQNIQAQAYRQKMKALENNKDSVAIYKLELENIDKIVKEKWKTIIANDPDGLLTHLVKALTDVEIPESPRDTSGRIIDSAFQYKFYKKHFFDNIDFSYNGLLRTPVYQSKLNFFLTKVIPLNPDSIIAESEKIIDNSRANREMFQFTLQYVYNHFSGSNLMGYDAIYVALGEKYYLSGAADWADTAFVRKLKDRISKTKPNLLGNIAPELKLITHDDNWASLRQINAPYTILYFWDPDCGHCKKETPKVHDIATKYWEKGVRVFAVYTQVEKEKWIAFINEKGLTDWINCWDPYNQSNFRNLYDIYSTPVIYLLDKNKKILAKRIDAETLEKILEQELK